MVLLSAQGMDVEQIAKVAFTSADRVRDVINNFNHDGFDSLYPRYVGGRPPTITLPQRSRSRRSPCSARWTTAGSCRCTSSWDRWRLPKHRYGVWSKHARSSGHT